MPKSGHCEKCSAVLYDSNFVLTCDGEIDIICVYCYVDELKEALAWIKTRLMGDGYHYPNEIICKIDSIVRGDGDYEAEQRQK